MLRLSVRDMSRRDYDSTILFKDDALYHLLQKECVAQQPVLSRNGIATPQFNPASAQTGAELLCGLGWTAIYWSWRNTVHFIRRFSP